MRLKRYLRDWAVLSENLPNDNQEGRIGETGRVEGPDTKLLLVVDFWGLRCSWKRSVLLVLGKEWCLSNSPLAKIVRALDLFEGVEDLNAREYHQKDWCKLSVILELLRKWRVGCFLKACRNLLVVLEVELRPLRWQAADEVSKAIHLINSYQKLRAQYRALPRHVGRHLGRAALWLVCPERLLIDVASNQLKRQAFEATAPCLLSATLRFSFTSRLFLWMGRRVRQLGTI